MKLRLMIAAIAVVLLGLGLWWFRPPAPRPIDQDNFEDEIDKCAMWARQSWPDERQHRFCEDVERIGGALLERQFQARFDADAERTAALVRAGTLVPGTERYRNARLLGEHYCTYRDCERGRRALRSGFLRSIEGTVRKYCKTEDEMYNEMLGRDAGPEPQ